LDFSRTPDLPLHIFNVTLYKWFLKEEIRTPQNCVVIAIFEPPSSVVMVCCKETSNQLPFWHIHCFHTCCLHVKFCFLPLSLGPYTLLPSWLPNLGYLEYFIGFVHVGWTQEDCYTLCRSIVHCNKLHI